MWTLRKMNLALSKQVRAHTIRALFAREFRAALINRYFQVFCALGLIGGMVAAIFSEDANATPVFYVQIAIYFVSLFALLAGVGSAQSPETETRGCRIRTWIAERRMTVAGGAPAAAAGERSESRRSV